MVVVDEKIDDENDANDGDDYEEFMTQRFLILRCHHRCIHEKSRKYILCIFIIFLLGSEFKMQTKKESIK